MDTHPDQYTSSDIERYFADSADRERHERRSPFEVDKARIIHSAAFRSLQGKTQVIRVGYGDFYRTRLTHSLEVAQLGRGLSQEADAQFKPDADLIEAVCLGHDIGHPPFGHAAERFLNSALADYGGFSANAQNLRALGLLEPKHPEGGVNLSRATLDGLIKYPNLQSSIPMPNNAEFVYDSDATLVHWIRGTRDTLALETQLAQWVDTVAYSVDDIEDSMLAGFIKAGDLISRAEEISDVAKKYGPAYDTDQVRELGRDLARKLFEMPKTERERRIALKDWASRTMSRELMAGCRIKLRDEGADSPRYKYTLWVPLENIRLANSLKAIAAVIAFSHQEVRTIEAAGVEMIRSILEVLTDKMSKVHIELLPLEFREMAVHADHCGQVRYVADFIAGMTERYVVEFHRAVALAS